MFNIFTQKKNGTKDGFSKTLKPDVGYIDLHADFSKSEHKILADVEPYTMTSPERVITLIRAIDYLHKNQINGSVVECGVWKGGSAMAAMLRLIELGDANREFYLYDNFTNISEPEERDVDLLGRSAREMLYAKAKSDPTSIWCACSLDETQENVKSTRYPLELVHFIQGDVVQTLDSFIPEKIALLRLDTDWYTSTKKELDRLYPKLVEGGILILDDYGHWRGSHEAVDEFIKESGARLFLSRVDYSCRIAVKTKQ